MTGERRARALITRLVAAHSVLFVLQASVFTAPALHQALRFDPARGLSAPWTLLTWPLVHDSLAHLVLALALLAIAGPRVVEWMGRSGFGLYYLYAVVGGAAVALGLGAIAPMPPLGGALAPALAVVLAWAWLADDEEVDLTPFVARVRVRTLVALGTVALGLFGVATSRPWLAVPQFGAMFAGALYLRLRAGGGRRSVTAPLPLRQVVLTRVAPRAEDREPAVTAGPRTAEADQGASTVPDAPPPPLEQQVDRVLDKISAEGLESLTPDERRLLDRYAERKRDQRNS